MRNVVLNHISSIGCCNPFGHTNPMLDSTTMLENGTFGLPYSFLPHFPVLPSGATISTPAISTPSFLMLPRFPLARFQSSPQRKKRSRCDADRRYGCYCATAREWLTQRVKTARRDHPHS